MQRKRRISYLRCPELVLLAGEPWWFSTSTSLYGGVEGGRGMRASLAYREEQYEA